MTQVELLRGLDLLADDHWLARELALRTGEALLALRNSCEFEGRELKDRGDVLANQILAEGLEAARPGDHFLSEEGTDDLARIGHDRVWILDPLDGTREFGELDRSDWAVHVSLAIGGEPVIGAVALPALGEVFSTSDPPPTPALPTGALRIVVSRSRPPDFGPQLARRLGGELVLLGSAGAKAMSVVKGEAHVYVHAGGQYEWDSCAPVAVAQAAGLHASRLDGSRLRYNQVDPYLPDIVICRPELSDLVLDAVASN